MTPALLQKSATAEPAEWHGDVLVKRIGFNTKYAAVVHETWTPSKLRQVRVKYTDKNGKQKHRIEERGNKNGLARAKFLELAMREEMGRVDQFIAEALKR